MLRNITAMFNIMTKESTVKRLNIHILALLRQKRVESYDFFLRIQ